jgi:hypothetical protein
MDHVNALAIIKKTYSLSSFFIIFLTKYLYEKTYIYDILYLVS